MVEHSDYVRLLADTGLIGLCLFVATMLSCMVTGWRLYRHAPSHEVRLAALFVVCDFPALMFCIGFDNIVNYALPAMQYPFAFTGLSLGLAERVAREQRISRRAARPPRGTAVVAPAGIGATSP